MSELDTFNNRFSRFPLRSKKDHTPDYKEKLKRDAKASLPPAKQDAETILAGEALCPYAERIRSLSKHDQADSLVYQTVVVAAFQAVSRVLVREQQAAEASISLAQGEKLQEMTGMLEAVKSALHASLTEQGAKMLSLASERAAPEQEDRSWWFALTEAIQALEQSMDWLKFVVSGQPRGGPACTLSSLVAHLLCDQYHALLEEAEQWME